MIADVLMAEADRIVLQQDWGQFYGWHDQHRQHDRTEHYRPAVQQCRDEFRALLEVIVAHRLIGGTCLQLGMGPSGGASHALWHCAFDYVTTVDKDAQALNEPRNRIVRGLTKDVWHQCSMNLDFLFIDAGHTYDEVAVDTRLYAPLVRQGGLVVWHDALKRKGYEDEIDVHKYLYNLSANDGVDITVLGTEVGTAWMVKR